MKMEKMMKWIFLCVLFVFLTSETYAQKFVYQAGVHSFFNNNEFFGCTVKTSQTMAGVHFVPQVGFSYQEKHRIFVGIDAMHEFGSDCAVGSYDPVAYYQFDSQPFVFYMGAFPRKLLQENYPRMFFSDSVRNYRPVMNGIFWEFRSKKDDHMNVWLDWTSRQTEQRRETFFMGWSGKIHLGIFYGQHSGYMFHFAGRMNPPTPEEVHDNGLMLTSIGVDLAKMANFEKLELNAGWSSGIERDRKYNEWLRARGLLSELKVEYRGIGLLNTLYSGTGQQVFYNLYPDGLYWGDQTYRASKYDRADIYMYFIKNHAVNVKLIYTMHFLENKIYHEQSLYAAFDLDNLSKKKPEKYKRFWENWFRQGDGEVE